MTASGAKSKVFVVDDDRGLLRLIEKALTREGFTVTSADSGAGAIEWLEGNEADLLLLDLKLQDAEAKDVIGKLTSSGRLIPFIIITGQGDERVAVEMMKSGAMDYVVKDVQFQDVLPTLVRRALKEIEKERKLAAAEEALRLSDERFRVALKNSPIFVFNQDQNLNYTWINNAPLKEKDVVGRSDENLFQDDEADRLTQIKARVIASGAGVRQEVSLTIAGMKRIFDLTVEPVRDAGGKIVGITGAAMDNTHHKRLEKEILQISEMEQRRIGQDLHDGICQHLTGIELMSGVLEQNLEKKANANAAQAAQIAAHVRDVIGQTRSLARGLSPVVLESEGLMAALEELAAHTRKLFNVDCSFACETPVFVHDLITATHLYRIAQEAVTNSIKHGKAKKIDISLTSQLERLILSIKDNGSGAVKIEPGKGMGLRIMQYRAGMIGATLLVQKQPTGGTAVICFMPAPADQTKVLTKK